MKNKQAIYILAVFLFAAYLGASKNVKAANCADCLYGSDASCYDTCDYVTPSNDSVNTTSESITGSDVTSDAQMQAFCSDNGQGYDPATKQCVDFVGPQMPTEADPGYGPQAPYTYSECKSDGGDEAYCGQFAGAPQSAQNISNMSAGNCKVDKDCGSSGYTCYQGSCIDDSTYSENVSWYDRAGNTASQFFTSSQPTSQQTAAAQNKVIAATSTADAAAKQAMAAKQAVAIECAKQPPTNCQSAQDAANAADAAAIQAISDLNKARSDAGMSTISADNSGINLVANGMLGPVYDQGRTNYPTGGNLYGSIGPSSYTGTNSGLPGAYTTSGAAGLYGPAKCGAGFNEIGGVCFPTNTGLANPSGGILQILTNLFSWLMMLFSILAVGAFVLSGVQYLTAAGDAKQAETAKNNAKFAIMGIIVGLSGFLIVKAISTALTGQSYFF